MALPLFGKKPADATDLIPSGWQLYTRPMKGEPPGTVFRIDPAGNRYVLTRLAPGVGASQEPRHAGRIETSLEIVGRLLGVVRPGAPETRNTRAFSVELTDSVHDVASAAAIDAVLKPYLEFLELRAGDRYFVIRESRSAKAVTVTLTEAEAGVLGGPEALTAAGLASVPDATGTRVTTAFSERLGVMFLADEIVPAVAALAAGKAELGRVAVNGPLQYLEADYATMRVHFATDRGMTASAKPSEKFDSKRGELRYGTCDVSIPRDHRMGELEAPSILKLEFKADPARHVVLLDVVIQADDEFFRNLSARVQAAPAKSAFLFVHGYNVTFEDAARRTAQMSYDLGFDGAPVFYSWPSEGRLAAYTVDETMAEWAAPHLERFLEAFVERSGAARIFIIAHSMGNRVLTRAATALLARRPELAAHLSEIVLTAPDIDADVFKEQIAPELTKGARPVTLYASSADLALVASHKIHGYPRAGDAGPNLLVLPGIETIDASAVDTSLIGHSYFAESQSVMADVFRLMRDGSRAAARSGLVAAAAAGGQYWVMRG